MTEPSQEPIRPDEVMPPGQTVQTRQLVQDAVLMIPNLVKLIGRLMTDPRVPRRSKIVLGAAAAYVVSPIDLIPEVIPVIGWADDVIFLMMALDALISRTGPEIVQEHWDGPNDLLGLIEDVLSLARNIVPQRLRSLFDRFSG
ncbi:MAG TPA: YkvA family protein [Acidimicrobiia bacterium]